MKILVSACILGVNCKYNGGNNYRADIVEFLKDKEVISICPEMMAGLPAPRASSEIVNGRVTDCNGTDVDEIYRIGVENALKKIEGEKIDLVILQSRSPTCGVNRIYDGKFKGNLIKGSGVFAKTLIERGYKVIDVEDF